ncbi:MAG TPA: hypothetical protein VFE67_00225 [Rudaea sp.]|nr:hypothetical protein [Rudaea sp.]
MRSRQFQAPCEHGSCTERNSGRLALVALVAKYDNEAPYNIAYVYAYRGEADKAFQWLDKAIEYGDPGLGGIVTENLFDKNDT